MLDDGLAAGNETEQAPVAAAEGAVAAFDEAAEQVFARLRGNPVADRVFYAASELGNFSLIWHGLAWGAVGTRHGRRNALRTSAALAAESALVNGPIKALFRRARPTGPVASVEHPHRLRQPLTSSFPSGHASAAVVAVTLLAEPRRPLWRGLLYGLGALVAASRVHVRIHHASDVVGGALVGVALSWVAQRIWPLRPKPRSADDSDAR